MFSLGQVKSCLFPSLFCGIVGHIISFVIKYHFDRGVIAYFIFDEFLIITVIKAYLTVFHFIAHVVRVIGNDPLALFKQNFCNALSRCNGNHIITAVLALPVILCGAVAHTERNVFFACCHTDCCNLASIAILKSVGIIIPVIPGIDVPAIVIVVCSFVLYQHIMFLIEFRYIRNLGVSFGISMDDVDINIFCLLCVLVIYSCGLPAPVGRITCNDADL